MPIATGVIEGACRHLIKDRMDITGARWSLVGAEAVLMNIGSFTLSQEFFRNHYSQYFNPDILKDLS